MTGRPLTFLEPGAMDYQPVFALTDEDRVRGANLKCWASSADVDAALDEQRNSVAHRKVDALDSRLGVRPFGLLDNAGRNGPHSDEAAAIHERKLRGEIDGHLHQRGNNGALFGKFRFKFGHRSSSELRRRIKALFGGRVE